MTAKSQAIADCASSVECDGCDRETESGSLLQSPRGYWFCERCIDRLIERVKAQTGVEMSDVGAAGALECQHFGYPERNTEGPSDQHDFSNAHRWGAEITGPGTATDYNRLPE